MNYDFMDRLKADVMHNRVLPGGRFFEPNDNFWLQLHELRTHVVFVDAGAGEGHVMRELIERGFKSIAIDIAGRDDQDPRVLPVDALTFKYGPSVWPLICRPNHDGWAAKCMRNALSRGASCMYVGKPSNFHQDAGGLPLRKWHDRAKPVGADGERIYFIEP